MTFGLRAMTTLGALLAIGCGGGSTQDTASVSPASAPIPVPEGEPPDNVVRDLLFEQYDEINKAGGLPLTITATGQSVVIKPTLYNARKESCRPLPQARAGQFECSLVIMLSLEPGDGEPSEQGERLFVEWDGAQGKWVRM